MSPRVLAEIARLPDLTVNQLASRYQQVCGEVCRSRNKQYLVRRIAWRLQANDEGGLSPSAIKRARELAVDADTRVTAPRKHSVAEARTIVREPKPFVDWDSRLPAPGNHIERHYKGQTIRVIILQDGFEYEGHEEAILIQQNRVRHRPVSCAV